MINSCQLKYTCISNLYEIRNKTPTCNFGKSQIGSFIVVTFADLGADTGLIYNDAFRQIHDTLAVHMDHIGTLKFKWFKGSWL